MKFSELQNKSKQELEKLVIVNKTKLRQTKFGLNSGKNKNADNVGAIRKDIARILTKLNQS